MVKTFVPYFQRGYFHDFRLDKTPVPQDKRILGVYRKGRPHAYKTKNTKPPHLTRLLNPFAAIGYARESV
jgi:hypothetical protein